MDLAPLFNLKLDTTRLKKVVMRILIIFLLSAGIIAYFIKDLITWLFSLMPDNISIIALGPADVFLSSLNLIIIFAAIITAPFFLIELLLYIMPALYPKEKALLYKTLPLSILFFIIGTVFGFYIGVVFDLIFLANYATSFGVTNQWAFGEVIKFLGLISFGFGIAFQMPLIIKALVRSHLVEISILKKKRPYIAFGLFLFTAILGPTDILTQIIFFIPLYFIFEGTLLYLSATNNKRRNTA